MDLLKKKVEAWVSNMVYNIYIAGLGNVSLKDSVLNTTLTSLALPGRNTSNYGLSLNKTWLTCCKILPVLIHQQIHNKVSFGMRRQLKS